MFQDNNLNSQLLEAVEEINKEQKLVLVDKIKKHFGDNLKGLTFAVWGLAFKPQTDDMREAPSITIINALVNAGAKIQAYDPAAMKEAEHIFGNQPNISYTQDEYQALQNADAMLLLTEWHQFRYPDFGRIKSILRQPIIFDGRNQYEPKTMKELGFTYYSIGRT
jgi:UDPglucose 6-dehydrogenase